MKLLRVCSMWQPWATLCVAPLAATGLPPKRHETRAFQPRATLPIDVAIHATKKWNRDNAWAATDPYFRSTLAQCGFLSGPHSKSGVLGSSSLKPLPFGAIIGVATIVAVKSTHPLLGAVSNDDFLFGDWSAGRFAWEFGNTRLLPEPVPFKGRQDVLYLLDPAVQAQVDEQLGVPA